ncbi:PorT family protein [bacterium SCSIO 12741]|nr:PorT family protein [bacterium SCSIO 12741]
MKRLPFYFLFVLLIALISSGELQAQKLTVGLRAGTSVFKVHNEDINSKTKFTSGLAFAVPIDIQLNKRFSLQPEIAFVQKGVRFENHWETDVRTTDVKTNYLEIPVLFKANFGKNRLKGHVFLGPSFGYATNRYTVKQIGDADKKINGVSFIDGPGAKSKRFEMNVVGGVGASFQCGPGSILLDARYSLGLTDNTKFKGEKPGVWSKTTNRGMTFSLGYSVPLSFMPWAHR